VSTNIIRQYGLGNKKLNTPWGQQRGEISVENGLYARRHSHPNVKMFEIKIAKEYIS
jgi:hypothetical protein